MTKIIDRFLEIKKSKVTDKTDNLIKDCFKFGIFKRVFQSILSTFLRFMELKNLILFNREKLF